MFTVFTFGATVSADVNAVNIEGGGVREEGAQRVIMAGMPSDPAGDAAAADRPEPGRSRYHHGDLANALTAAGVALAREGGPDAVVLREAARRVGVSPAAAYRHFAGHDELRHAVKLRAQDQLAEAMETGISAGPEAGDPATEAVRQMGAIGTAYLHFALSEPGLFRTAFCLTAHDEDDHTAASQDSEGAPPSDIEHMLEHKAFQILHRTLDLLVDCGVLAPALRPLAEIPAWSAVHGLATLMLDGPLKLSDPELVQTVGDKVLDCVLHGLLHDPGPPPE